MTVEEYALKLLYQGAESYAEDDVDEEAELDNRDHLRAAIKLSIEMAHAIRDNPEAFVAWFAEVNA